MHTPNADAIVGEEVHADRSLIRLSPERLCQSLTNTEVDAEHGVPDGGIGEGTEGAEGVCSSMGEATVSTSQTPWSF